MIYSYQWLRPTRSYVVRVQARYAGGDGLGGGWSADLARSFQTPTTWRPSAGDGAILPAPQLLPEPAGASRSTQAIDIDIDRGW